MMTDSQIKSYIQLWYVTHTFIVKTDCPPEFMNEWIAFLGEHKIKYVQDGNKWDLRFPDHEVYLMFKMKFL